MSIREQERRQKRAEKRINDRMRRADTEVRNAMDERSRQADLRAKEVVRRIERGGADPRPLLGVREDSMGSMESLESMGSMGSSPSIESADPATEVSVDASTDEPGENMPLEDAVPYNAGDAGDDLAGRVTEDTGGHGDPHAHNEQKAGALANQMTGETGAEGDMTAHAEGKVAQHGERMFAE